LAKDHVRPASVVYKATDGAAGRTLSATITHDAAVAHDTLVVPSRNDAPVVRDGMRMATSNALGALVEDQVRPPLSVSDMNQLKFGGAGSSLALRTTQVLGLVHSKPLVGWPGRAS
jgi:hypothetical protein